LAEFGAFAIIWRMTVVHSKGAIAGTLIGGEEREARRVTDWIRCLVLVSGA